MIGYFLRKIGRALLTLAIIFTVVFAAVRVTGDPVDMLLPDGAPPEARAALTQYLGLDRPIHEQFSRYFFGFLSGEFGASFQERRPVSLMYRERIGATLRLTGLALAISVGGGLVLGIVGAVRNGRPIGRVAMGVSFFAYAVPHFVLGILLILVFSFYLNWLPSNGDDGFLNYLMPAATLAAASMAAVARFMRGALLDVLSQDYLRTARAKGLAERGVILGHALRNALIPVITVVGLQVGTLVAGAVVLETVFAWPGVGRLLVNAVIQRDYPVVQFGVLFVAASVVVANSAVDVIYAAVDPRVRVGA